MSMATVSTAIFFTLCSQSLAAYRLTLLPVSRRQQTHSLPRRNRGVLCIDLYITWRSYTALHNHWIRTHTRYMRVQK